MREEIIRGTAAIDLNGRDSWDTFACQSATEIKTADQKELSSVSNRLDAGRRTKEVPIWQKSYLTLEEAAAYSGIGINKLRQISDSDRCTFVLWNGSKRLLKRRKLDEYLDGAFSI